MFISHYFVVSFHLKILMCELWQFTVILFTIILSCTYLCLPFYDLFFRHLTMKMTRWCIQLPAHFLKPMPLIQWRKFFCLFMNLLILRILSCTVFLDFFFITEQAMCSSVFVSVFVTNQWPLHQEEKNKTKEMFSWNLVLCRSMLNYGLKDGFWCETVRTIKIKHSEQNYLLCWQWLFFTVLIENTNFLMTNDARGPSKYTLFFVNS